MKYNLFGNTGLIVSELCFGTMTFGGEGASKQMDIFLTPDLSWEDAPTQSIDEETRRVILRRITAALQWAGFSVGFFELIEE